MEAAAAFNGHTETVDGLQGQCLRGPFKIPLPLKKDSAEEIVKLWYAEAPRYNFSTPGPNPKCMNFTQMVWGNSSSVGMAISEDGRFAVANFYPAGNVEPDCDWVRHVRPLQNGQAPWYPAEKTHKATSALCAENWRQHEALEEAMRTVALNKSEFEDTEIDFEAAVS